MTIDQDVLKDAMEEKKNKARFLLFIAQWTGRISLMVGWGIFLIWLFLNAAFQRNFYFLEDAGVHWILIGFALCTIGIISAIIYSGINQWSSDSKVNRAVGLIILNIPSVFLIVFLAAVVNYH